MKVDLEQKLKELFSDKSTQKLLGVIILKTDNSYELFNSYKIVYKKTYWLASSLTTSVSEKFYTIKSAVSYCIFHYANNIQEAEQVRLLDSKLGGAQNNKIIYTRLYKKHRATPQGLIYAAKIGECDCIIKQLTPILEKYWIKSREQQLRKFSAYQINTL